MTAHRRAKPRAFLPTVVALATAATGGALATRGRDAQPAPLPERLADTGLFAGGSGELGPGVLAYSPQYPLWTDGAAKRRWLKLPDGAAIDARDPDAWVFPAGTRLWKEFRFGRRVETRYLESLGAGRVRYATYLWSQDGLDARLLPPEEHALVPVADGVSHEVPNESDCRACHEGRRSGVLGVNALQLSPDRDPNALHADPPQAGEVDLPALVARALIEGLPPELLRTPPRIRARSPRERAALGYLFGNCAGCHNAQGPLASVGLDFDQRLGRPVLGSPLPSAIGRPSGFVIPGARASLRIAPGRPEHSAVAHRMGSRFGATQMPPLGTRLVDEQALELIRNWIARDLAEVAQRGEPK